jgi:NAD+ kinase
MDTGSIPVIKHRATGIISKPTKPALVNIVPPLLDWLKAHDYRVIIDRETSPYAPDGEVVSRKDFGSRNLDFVIVLGGDGTLLAASRAVARAAVPVIGVNLGSLGFLTEVPLEELYSTLEGLERGVCEVEVRSMLHCELHRAGTCVAEFDALNDIVVGKSTISRLNHCDVYVDNVFVSVYKADSLIVSTPTGSTAYSLAAGGPILMPSVEAFVITPVSAHSLTHRPVVVRDTSCIEIVARTGEEEAYLSIDGQVGMPMYDQDRVVCRKSEHTVRLMRIKRGFFEVLRTKLKWGQR